MYFKNAPGSIFWKNSCNFVIVTDLGIYAGEKQF